MAGINTFFGCVIFGVFISGVRSFEENSTEITITDSKSLKRIEFRQTYNITSNASQTPTIIQRENNLLIKPKIILGSPLTSYSPALKLKLPDEEASVMIEKLETHASIIGLPPPEIIPNSVEGDTSKLPSKISYRPMTRFPYMFPVSAYYPQVPTFPILKEKPVRPIVIPKPPELPPLLLPNIPIQVIVQRPIIPIHDHRIILPPLCSPMIKCIDSIPTEKVVPSASDAFRGILQKFKNLLTISSEIDLNNIFVPDKQISTTHHPLIFPTLCAQGIIGKRVVPNIFDNSDIKVFLSPISAAQLANFDYHYQ